MSAHVSHGLGTTQRAIIEWLSTSKRPATAREVQTFLRRVGRSYPPSSVHRLMRKLQARGLVREVRGSRPIAWQAPPIPWRRTPAQRTVYRIARAAHFVYEMGDPGAVVRLDDELRRLALGMLVEALSKLHAYVQEVSNAETAAGRPMPSVPAVPPDVPIILVPDLHGETPWRYVRTMRAAYREDQRRQHRRKR